MDIEFLRNHILALRGVSESFPFDTETLVFKVQGKMFAVIALEKPDRITLKCAPAYAQELRCNYGGIGEAYHFNKTHWNEVRFPSDVPDALLLHLIGHAYADVLHRLPKKTQVAFFAEGLPPHISYQHLNVCNSTMLQVRTLAAELGKDAPDGGVQPPRIVLTDTDLQRAGRGQHGTTWESENGKNLLFSLSFHAQGVKATQQFRVLQAAALALHETVSSELYGSGAPPLTIKWPNDIYCGDRKLAGMLLEHDVCGDRLGQSVLGIGLNTNQALFRSDAPNPIALCQLSGHEHNRFLILSRFLSRFQHLLAELESHRNEAVEQPYLRRLYRRSGFHAYQDAAGKVFRAEFAGIEPDGRLTLRTETGEERSFAFKEIAFA